MFIIKLYIYSCNEFWTHEDYVTLFLGELFLDFGWHKLFSKSGMRYSWFVASFCLCSGGSGSTQEQKPMLSRCISSDKNLFYAKQQVYVCPCVLANVKPTSCLLAMKGSYQKQDNIRLTLLPIISIYVLRGVCIKLVATSKSVRVWFI